MCLCGVVAAQQQPLAIREQPLLPLVAGMDYRMQLYATGGEPPYVWSVVSGDLPEGISLSADGCLCGRPSKAGAYDFTLKVEDSSRPSKSVPRSYHETVSAPMLLEWLEPPKVSNDRIDGSVQVSNGTKNTFDLTVVIVAVAVSDQRATAIGYQHFPLEPGASNVPISFGNTLPNGAYVIHADAIAEIAARNSIFRQRLQTPTPLQITVGP
jgi:hypothetical protein